MILAASALIVWAYLLALHGQFWRSGPVLDTAWPDPAPEITVVVPARDEADVIGTTLGSLLAQDYPGLWRIILIDDGSSDGTGAIARALDDGRLTVLDGAPRPDGWSGKLWATQQGVAAATGAYVLLTDADIVHDPGHLSALVARSERENLDLVSEMVRLACESPAERALVPAFVFFFQLLYPFARVNRRDRRTAAAAGGTMLVRRTALGRAGGIAGVRDALIDDVALARALKRDGAIWLGHADLARSVRPYPAFADIWRMIARTAFVQLRFSAVMLALTTAALALTFLAPPLSAVLGHGATRWMGLAAWLGMAGAYQPTLRRYGRSPLWGLALPLVACFYMAATIGSAIDHWRGRGVVWKGRAYG